MTPGIDFTRPTKEAWRHEPGSRQSRWMLAARWAGVADGGCQSPSRGSPRGSAPWRPVNRTRAKLNLFLLPLALTRQRVEILVWRCNTCWFPRGQMGFQVIAAFFSLLFCLV